MLADLDFVKHKATGRKMRVVALVCQPVEGGDLEQLPLAEVKDWRDPPGTPSFRSYTYDPNDND